MNIIEERGIFWWRDEAIPDGHKAPACAVSGGLRITSEGEVSLELDGVLSADGQPFSPYYRSFDKTGTVCRDILGLLTKTNEQAVLLNVSDDGSTGRSPGISTDKCKAEECLVGRGEFAPGAPPLHFDRMKVSLAGYEKWLGLRSIQMNVGESTFSATYKRPEPLVFKLKEGSLQVKYSLSSLVSRNFSFRTEAIAAHEAGVIEYALGGQIPIREAFYCFQIVTDLLILLTDSEFHPDYPTFSICEANGNPFKYYFTRRMNGVESPKTSECCVLFSDIAANFGSIFENWKNKRKLFGAGFNLFFSTRRGMDLYTEHHFISLMWGLETFHRIKFRNTANGTALSKKIERILKQITSAKDQRWLKGVLRGEPNLETRLLQLFDSIGLAVEAARVRDFATKCTRWRNDLSHFGEGRIANDIEMMYATLALSHLYHLILLSEIGINILNINKSSDLDFSSARTKAVFERAGLLPSAS